MILDSGICTVFRESDTSQPGYMPVKSYTPIWASWYKELDFETVPTWATEGRKELQVNARIRITQHRAIAQNDIVILEHLESYESRSEGAVVYRVVRAFHGKDDDGPTLISDLSLEVINP